MIIRFAQTPISLSSSCQVFKQFVIRKPVYKMSMAASASTSASRSLSHIQQLIHSGGLSEAARLLESQLLQGKYCRLDDVNYVIQGFGRVGDARTAQRVFDLSLAHGFKPTFVLLNSLLFSYCRAGDVSNSVKIFKHFSETRMTPNLQSYNFLIDCLSRHGNVRDALLWLDRCAESKLTPGNTCFSSLVKACSAHKRGPDEVLKLIARMERFGIEVNISTWNLLLESYANCKDVAMHHNYETLLEQFAKIPDVNSASYRAVTQALLNFHQPEVAADFLFKHLCCDDIAKTRVKPVTEHFGYILCFYSKADNDEGAMQLFDRMVDAKVPLDTACYNHVLAALSRSDDVQSDQSAKEESESSVTSEPSCKVETAKRYFEELCATSFGPDAYSYANMVTLFSSSENFAEEHQQLLKRMEVQGLNPDLVMSMYLTHQRRQPQRYKNRS